MSGEQKEIILKSRVFAVERQNIQLRGGEWRLTDIVRHPGAVCVVPILDDGRIVTIRNFRIATDTWMNEFCAGKFEIGEDPARAAARELEEETGYTASTLKSLGTFYTSPGFTDELIHAFVARGLRPCPRRLELDERIEVVVRTVEEFESLIRSGEIADGKTLATFLRWRLIPQS